MDIFVSGNSLADKTEIGAFDNVLGTVAGNQFFDKDALKQLQTEQLRDAFFDWATDEFLGEDEEGNSNSIHSDIIKGFEEYRESWEKFNVKEAEKANLKIQIEKLEKIKIYEQSLQGAIENRNKIAALKAQLSQIQ